MDTPDSLGVFRLYVLPQAPLRFVPCCVDLNDNDDFFYVKSLIGKMLEMGEKGQILSYGGEVLQDEKTPIDYEMRSGSVLLLNSKA